MKDTTLRKIRATCQKYQCACDECPSKEVCDTIKSEFMDPYLWEFEDDTITEIGANMTSCPECGSKAVISKIKKETYVPMCSNMSCKVNMLASTLSSDTPKAAVKKWEKFVRENRLQKEVKVQGEPITPFQDTVKLLDKKKEEILCITREIERCLAEDERMLCAKREDTISYGTARIKYTFYLDKAYYAKTTLTYYPGEYWLSSIDIAMESTQVPKRCTVIPDLSRIQENIPYGLRMASNSGVSIINRLFVNESFDGQSLQATCHDMAEKLELVLDAIDSSGAS